MRNGSASLESVNLNELFCDEAFLSLRKRADEGLLLRCDLEDEKLPLNWSADDTWLVLGALRFQTSQVLPWESYVDIGRTTKVWYTTTAALAEGVNLVDRAVRKGSPLDQAIGKFRGVAQVAKFREWDIAAALALDGVALGAEDVRAVLNGERAPSCTAEHLVLNSWKVLSDLSIYDGREMGPGLMEDVYYRLTEGVGQDGFTAPESPYVIDDGSPYHDRDVCLLTVARIARGDDGDPLFHPLFRVLCIQWLLRDFRPFERFNALVATVVRQIVLRRCGYPVLEWLPLNDLLQFKRVTVGGRERAFEEVFETCLYDFGFGLDATMWFLIICEYARNWLGEIGSIVLQLEELGSRVDRALDVLGRINHRERAILANAIQDPQSGQRIEAHRRHFGVAYATARKDFIQLTERGFLVRETEGQAFVYKPHPRLTELFEKCSVGSEVA